MVGRDSELALGDSIGTIDPLKNRRCFEAYLYELVARVTTAAGSVTLRRDVSVCPRVR